ncbi:MAG TPA: hypothetical protein VIM51_12495 [Desulfosporosinus sp.]
MSLTQMRWCASGDGSCLYFKQRNLLGHRSPGVWVAIEGRVPLFAFIDAKTLCCIHGLMQAGTVLACMPSEPLSSYSLSKETSLG